jgi:DNA-binding transcriptional regulator YiaG
MSKHIEEMPKVRPKRKGRVPTRVPNGPDRLPEYDATALTGLRTVVYDAAIEHVGEDGEVTIELPQLPALMAAAAVSRCLDPIRLGGSEIRAIRKIMGLTLAELAKRLDARTATETVSRWEANAQPMGSYAERVLRLVVCEALTGEAPGIDYNAGMIAELQLADGDEAPIIELVYGRLKEQAGGIIDAWEKAAA